MNYKEVSYKMVDGVFRGRIYEIKDGKTVAERNDYYTDEQEFKEEAIVEMMADLLIKELD